jgi:transcriptional regulator NrdR family protein
MENEAIFRRRRCESCGERWNTYEIAAPELDNLRRATAEIYDRLKKVINRFQAIDLDVLNNGECFKVLHRFIGKD